MLASVGLWALNRLFGKATIPKGSSTKPVVLGKNVMLLRYARELEIQDNPGSEVLREIRRE